MYFDSGCVLALSFSVTASRRFQHSQIPSRAPVVSNVIMKYMSSSHLYSIKRLGFALIALFVMSACDSPSNSQVGVSNDSSTSSKSSAFKNYRETGDLQALKKRGVLRLLAPRREAAGGLPRHGLPAESYRNLAEEFARSLDLQPQWIIKDSLADLITALTNGEGDLTVSHMTRTAKRSEEVAFSLAISRARERILTPAGAPVINNVADLNGKTLLVPEGSSYHQSLLTLAKANESIKFTVDVQALDGDPDRLVDMINSPGYDATVVDGNVAETLSQYRDDFAIGIAVSEIRPVGWTVRKNATELLSKLNIFLTESLIAQGREQNSKADLPTIKKHGILRMITRNSPASYFMWRGELMGFEYDLMKKFAEEQGLKLQVEVAPPGVSMLDWLEQGKGDVVAAAMTITEERQARKIRFTRFYNKVHEQMVTHVGAKPIASLADLKGRTLHIKQNHAYWETAQNLLDEGAQFTLSAPPSDLGITDMLGKIASGEYDATLADSHLIAIEHKFMPELQPGLKLEPAREHAWAVRQENPQLLAALNQFLNKQYRGLFFNVTRNKYFKREEQIDKYLGERLAGDVLSPYDGIVKPLAQKFHFDWRIVIAQMYQESQFNPKARSFAGARGLLQVMPRTAKELGYSLPFNEETGIRAGIEYLDWTRDRFEEHLPLDERLWFALAAYNAGYGHVYDARRLARRKGWDPDKWFGNVEKAMLLLAKREYYSKARFGYVRGSEPVHYVRDIRDRYHAYLALN